MFLKFSTLLWRSNRQHNGFGTILSQRNNASFDNCFYRNNSSLPIRIYFCRWKLQYNFHLWWYWKMDSNSIMHTYIVLIIWCVNFIISIFLKISYLEILVDCFIRLFILCLKWNILKFLMILFSFYKILDFNEKYEIIWL